MCSTPERLAIRTPKKGRRLFKYIVELIHQYRSTDSNDVKENVLNKLSRFAYSPVNHPFLRELSVIDVFLNQLAEEDPWLQKTALGGLDNLAFVYENKDYIVQNGGVDKIAPLLRSEDETVVLWAISTLMLLVTPRSKKDITRTEIIKIFLELTRGRNKRISHLSDIFLRDYCTSDQINRILQSEEIQNIPIPGQSSS